MFFCLHLSPMVYIETFGNEYVGKMSSLNFCFVVRNVRSPLPPRPWKIWGFEFEATDTESSVGHPWILFVFLKLYDQQGCFWGFLGKELF